MDASVDQPDVIIGDFDAKPLDPPPDANTGCDAKSIGPLFADIVTVNPNPDTEINWQERNNALLQDNARSTAVAVFGGKPNSVKIGWVDFAKSATLPANAAEIVGIKVEVVGKSNVAGAFHDDFVGLRIVGDPNTVSGNHAVELPAVTPATWDDGDDTTHTFGGPTTKWELGAKLTPDLVRDPNFAIVYAVAVNNPTGQQFYLNAAKMTVFYCESP